MQIGGTPFGQLTQLGRDLFDKFRQGQGLDESLTGNDPNSAIALPSSGTFGPAALLPPDLGQTETGLNGGNAVQATGDAATADPVNAAFELLQRDLTGMFGMLGYDEGKAKDAAKAMTDAAREAYGNGQAFSFSQVAVETAEHYQKGPNGSMYMGTLAAQSIELYVDPATGTFSAKAVSVEIKTTQMETSEPVDFGKWRDSQDALFGALDLDSPLEGTQSMAEMLLEKMRKLQEELEKKRLAEEQTQQISPAKLASSLQPKDAEDIGKLSDKGVLALRLDALVPLFAGPTAQQQASQPATGQPATGLNVVA